MNLHKEKFTFDKPNIYILSKARNTILHLSSFNYQRCNIWQQRMFRFLHESSGQRFGGNKLRVEKFRDESWADEVERVVDRPEVRSPVRVCQAALEREKSWEHVQQLAFHHKRPEGERKADDDNGAQIDKVSEREVV